MNKQTLALIIQEGSRLLSEAIRNKDILFRSHESEMNTETLVVDEEPTILITEDASSISGISEKSTAVPTGCVPCSIGHIGTCSGLLNEAMRFARNDGVESEEVITRVNMCLDELNALERVDLRPEMIHGLPEWEKSLAEKALSLSRSLRHDLEGLSTLGSLEEIAAKTQGMRQEIGKGWFQGRLSRMTSEQRQNVENEIQETLSLQEAKEIAADEAIKEVEKQWNKGN